MDSQVSSAAEEMRAAEGLPQADASDLVDSERLEDAVKDMYRHVAREEDSELHFEVGRPLAERLGYPPDTLDRVPAEAIALFAGVGYHLDLAELRPGEAVLDLGCGSGTDVFCAAVMVGERGLVAGVDFTDQQLAKAERLLERDGFEGVEFVEASIAELPFEDGGFDAVISKGVINLSPIKHVVFSEAARVCARAAGWCSPTSSAPGRSRSAPAATSTSGRRAWRVPSRTPATRRRSRPSASRLGRCGATITSSPAIARSRR